MQIGYHGLLRNTEQERFNYAYVGDESVTIHDWDLEPDVANPYISWGVYNVSAELGDNNEAGFYEPLLIVDNHFGKAGWHWTSDNYKLDGTSYKFQVVGDMTGVSENGGSAEGGHLLTINGNGFSSDTSKVTAEVNGNACEVLSSSRHEITCRTSANAAATQSEAPYAGGSGLKRLRWSEITGNTVDPIADYLESDATISDILTTAENGRNRGLTYKQKITGLFKAPRTGGYTFYVTSDDHSRVWLSSDATPENKGDPIIDFSDQCNYRYEMFFGTDRRSEEITL
jgi:hypothetical protein